MAKPSLETKDVAFRAIDATQLFDAGQRSANMMTAAAELVAKTMGEIVAKQADLLRVEGNEIAKSAAALATVNEPVEAMQNYAAALRDGADGALSDLREIQDLMRGCAWELVGLYVDSISVGLGNGRPAHH
jgi:hypothetical protein